MIKQLIPALRATLVLAFLTGLVFPLTITALAQTFFPDSASGSLIKNKKGEVIGSLLLGQKFERPEYFHPRPSAAGSGWAGEASGGTNLGPTSSKLILGKEDDPNTKDANETFLGVKQLSVMYRQENELLPDEEPPVDAVTRSASGLDPDISLVNAAFQARRIAKQRSMPVEDVLALVKRNSQGHELGIFGEPRVNVLKLNLALDDVKLANATETKDTIDSGGKAK